MKSLACRMGVSLCLYYFCKIINGMVRIVVGWSRNGIPIWLQIRDLGGVSKRGMHFHAGAWERDA